MGDEFEKKKDQSAPDAWQSTDASVAPSADPTIVPDAGYSGAGRNPEAAAVVFKGQYDGGERPREIEAARQPEGLHAGGGGLQIDDWTIRGFPAFSTSRRFDNPENKARAEEETRTEQEARRRADKPFDPIGDMLRPKAKPSTQERMAKRLTDRIFEDADRAPKADVELHRALDLQPKK